MGRPRGGEWLDDEIAWFYQYGVHTIVSLLETDEIEELELHHENACCQKHAITYVSFPIQDRNVPTSLQEAHNVVSDLYQQLITGRGIAIHCRAGIGRSALIAACLFLHAHYTVKDAFAAITQDRHVPVPDTEKQRQWVNRYYQEYVQEKNVRSLEFS